MTNWWKNTKSRAEKWSALTDEDKTQYKKRISRSARDDYRDYVNDILNDLETETDKIKLQTSIEKRNHFLHDQKDAPLYNYLLTKMGTLSPVLNRSLKNGQSSLNRSLRHATMNQLLI